MMTRHVTINLKYDYCEEKELREQADKCGTSAKKRKTGNVSTHSELENVLFAWYHQARASGIPVDGRILRENPSK
jgi:hypothetical protein